MHANPNDQTLSVQGINKRYGTFQALNDVGIDVKRGEFLTLLGPSGSGKTTLLMSVAGFIQPDSGRIMLGAQDITFAAPEKRNFGMVFQGYALFPHLKVRENVAFPLKMRGIRGAAATKSVAEALELVGLADKGERYPRELSGGQQQRVALARAIVFQPHLLLLDEPLSALDTQLRGQLQTELKRLHRAVGLTFIYVTHDQGEALSMSDRIAVMKDGRIVQLGAPSALYNRPANRFVAEFLGVENFLPERLTGRQGLLAVRASALSLAGKAGRISARVSDLDYHGAEIRYTAQTECGLSLRFNLSLRDAAHVPQENENVTLDWQEKDALPFPAA
ncbi:ABC transporter ATP-binding protein [Xinfangfangia sp. D13-10-4-6]|uniref:ABC transporter ATP-binding protein n=1 Tax=Pseudogemmobacter hezensis TaxID=2737662 RepID=UPI0015541906|nr:ABC transporter ATP-binding protein [Pseudogemmobacter hezensis]NPD17442.1 ABC transporter ATP-binding protein [Pseudogemmobacter hezensis]